MGFAVGIAVLLVGVVLGWLIVAIGAAIAALFGFLWIREVTSPVRTEEPPAVPEPEARPPTRGRTAVPEPGEGEMVRFPRSMLIDGVMLQWVFDEHAVDLDACRDEILEMIGRHVAFPTAPSTTGATP